MFDLDLMLGGQCRRQHHQDLIRETQQHKLAREAQNGLRKSKVPMSLRVIWAAIVNLITR
jgi:hypothetical protein